MPICPTLDPTAGNGLHWLHMIKAGGDTEVVETFTVYTCVLEREFVGKIIYETWLQKKKKPATQEKLCAHENIIIKSAAQSGWTGSLD